MSVSTDTSTVQNFSPCDVSEIGFGDSWKPSVICDNCGRDGMRPETSHYKCDSCGFILPCCEGAPL